MGLPGVAASYPIGFCCHVQTANTATHAAATAATAVYQLAQAIAGREVDGA